MKALQRVCYGCRKPLGAQVFSVDWITDDAWYRGRQLVCLDCVIAGEYRTPRSLVLTCDVCRQRFTRFYRVGYSHAASVNGTQREVTRLCSAVCAARQRRQRQRPPIVWLTCASCGVTFLARRDAKTCSPRCRVRRHRAAPTGDRSEGGMARKISPLLPATPAERQPFTN